MIKIKLFNSKKPTDSQDLELKSDTLLNGECLIGSASNCCIVLPNSAINDVHGSIRAIEGQYYFTHLATLGTSQFNDLDVQAERPYLLETNDIIRIGEFVLIVDSVPLNGKTKTKKEKLSSPKETREIAKVQTQSEIQKHSIKSLQALKALLKKNPQDSQTTTRLPDTKNEGAGTQKHPNTELLSPPLPLPLPPSLKQETLSQKEQINTGEKGNLTARCVGVINETQDVKTFRFAVNPPVQFSYQPGQFVTLNLNIQGKPVKRSYSISSTPSRPHTIEITVKRVPAPPDVLDIPPGLVSNWLHDNISVGSEIQLSGPFGKFTCLAHPSRKLLLISAGSGITPMMSMSRWAWDTATDWDIVFFHSARNPEDLIFQRELALMSAQNPWFRLALTITRSESGYPWWSFTGRLTEQMLQAIAPDFQERTVYVCGPNSFMQGVKSMMEGLNFPMQNYYEESFGSQKKRQGDLSSISPSSPPSSPHALYGRVSKPAPTPHMVVFAQSQQEISSRGESAILDLAEQEGVEIDSSCRSGTCGTCKVRKLEGNVRYEGEPDALSESEQQEYILACIAHPVGRIVIDA